MFIFPFCPILTTPVYTTQILKYEIGLSFRTQFLMSNKRLHDLQTFFVVIQHSLHGNEVYNTLGHNHCANCGS